LSNFAAAVTEPVLLILAGLIWSIVGIMLLHLAYLWLKTASDINFFFYSTPGLLMGILIHHFGFLKIVDKNIIRILQMKGKKCLFAFIPWKSYITIGIMITMGILLRHSMIPKKDLAILYIGIGLALFLSSIKYLKVFYMRIQK